MRKIVSLTASLSFVLVVLTSVILFIMPQGRVAYWADWRLWGLSKTAWGNLHIDIGLLFLIALGLHLYYNWKPLAAYLKDRARRFRLFTREFNFALTITAACVLGSYFQAPPFSWVTALNDQFKAVGAARYGEPPYGHAELSSLKAFARKMDLDLDKSLLLLGRAGMPVASADATLADIARLYRVTPQHIYATIRSASLADPVAGQLPDEPAPGTGNQTLADFCAQYGLDIKQVIRRLKMAGIDAVQEASLKKIAADHQMSPIDLYETIRRSSR